MAWQNPLILSDNFYKVYSGAPQVIKTDSQGTNTLQLGDTALIVVLGLLLMVFSKVPPVIRTLPYGWPEWNLILAVYLAFRAETWLACLGAFFLGSFQEAMNLVPNGLEPLMLILLVMGLSFFSRHVKLQGFFYLAVFLLIIFFIKDLFFIPGFLSIMGLFPDYGLNFLGLGWVFEAFLTGLVGPLIFSILDFLFFFRRESHR
jgi:hypothetical protein